MTFADLMTFDSQYVKTGGSKHFSLRGAEVFSDLVAGVLSATTKEKIGTVSEVLRDRTGKVEALVVNLGFKRVVLPYNRFWIAQKENRIYAAGLSREQVTKLPEFK